MDEGKILIVNLSRGLIGEDNAAILGAFLVTKIQLAAMSRADIPNIEDRRPFYLYVDEFQNFATDSFAVILSEARKYGLNLTVANQYIAQLQDTVRAAVFGNVGSMISFRVSADDAPTLAKQFEPQFEPGDLLQMHNRSFIINMVIKGEKAPAFSATTLTIPTPQTDYFSNIVDNSRHMYSRDRVVVEKEIDELIAPVGTPQPAPRPVAVDAIPAMQRPPMAESVVEQGSPAPVVLQEKSPEPAMFPVTAPVDEEAAPKKRKRTRSRSRKKKGEAGETHTPAPVSKPSEAPEAPRQAPAAPKSDPTELRLRH
jgi:hypothetical protein